MASSFGLRRMRWLLLAALAAAGAEPRPLEFQLTFDPSISREPFSGRVYVMLFKGDPGDKLRASPNWFKPDPMFAVDVKGWEPGKPVIVGANAIGYPVTLSKLEKGTYYIQAVMDFGRGMSFSAAPGNGWCSAGKHELDPATGGRVALKLDKVYEERKFPESDRVKLVDIESKLLSAFYGRPVHMRAGVVLPASWGDGKGRKYRVVYEIPGFGGTHFMAAMRKNSTDVAGTEMIWVVLDPACPLGHHVFADSANNGPCGQALIEELIPQIEKTFRGLVTPEGRFVTGHSSGGWSSLWLQVTYPDFFGGVWSTSPDPVDFRDFQRIDLTRPGVNMFTDEEGKPRPLARSGDKPLVYYKPFSDMEEIMGHGGQLGSFEAVFGPRGPDGRPARLWDRRTGQVDPGVAHAWEAYDIRLKLERNWKTIGPKLTGKLHVYTGGADTFYLEGATRLLGEALKKLGSDAVVEIFPGKNHASLLDAKLRQRIATEMAAQSRRPSVPKQ
jgi:pimeloyl-ACP methyl ester carboxylesterase